MAMRKLLIILYEDFPWYSGLSERTLGIIRHLASCNVNIRVFAPLFLNYKKIEALERIIERIRLCKFRKKSKLTKLLSFVSWIYFQFRCFFKILRNARSIAIIQYEHYYAFLLAYFVKVLFKKPIIADDINLLNIRPLPPLRRKIFYIIERFILEKSSLVTTASPITYAYTKTYFPNTRIIYMPNAINKIPELRNYTRKKWIVFIGNLGFKQNIEAVKRIFKIIDKLAKMRNDFKVLIIGANADKAQDFTSNSLVKRGIVEFLGTVPDTDLDRILNQATIALLPFFGLPRWGGQMTKTLKFMSYGICIVASPEAVKWINGIKSGVHYVLITSIEEGVNTLNRLLDNIEYCKRIGLNARRFVISKYTCDKIYAKYSYLIKKVVNIYR